MNSEFIDILVWNRITHILMLPWEREMFPMDCSLPGSSVHGILQGSILQWVVIPSSRESS